MVTNMNHVLVIVSPDKERGSVISDYVKDSVLLYDEAIAITTTKTDIKFYTEKTIVVDDETEETFKDSLEKQMKEHCNNSCIYDICGIDNDYDLIRICYMFYQKGLYFRILADKCLVEKGNVETLVPNVLFNCFPNKVVM